MASLVGKTLLDRYNVQEFLGRGGMAEVYKVWDSHRMTYLAMKVLLEDLAVDKVFMRRFAREAKTLEKLQHPSIVRFYGLEREGRLAFMLMDYIEGDNLKPLIFDYGGALPNEQVSAIMRAIAGALSYAHRQGMVHCDIKSANIMLNKHGEAMLTDFGIARMTDAATATMVGAGTPAYMAPEQVKGLDPTPQSDLYSLGIVLYEMLTGGERPFTGETATITGSTSEKVRWEQLNAAPTPPSHWNTEISPELEAVVLKCLQKDGKKRYQSTLELINALELASGGKESAERPQPKLAPVKKAPVAPKPIPSKPALQPVEKRPENFSQSTPSASDGQKPVKSTLKWLPAAGIAIIAIILLGTGLLLGGRKPVAPAPTSTPHNINTPKPTNTVAPAYPNLDGREITIAIENAYLPFNYIDPETGEGAGWDYEVWDEICNLINCVPVYTEAAWEGMIQAVADGQFDVAADGITITDNRAKVVDFSMGYVAIEQRLLVRVDEDRIESIQNIVDNADLKLGTQTGTINYETALNYLSADRVEAFEQFPFAVQALFAGDIDAVIMDEFAGLGYLGENADAFKLVGKSLDTDHLGFIYPKGSDLVDPVDAALEEFMRNGFLEEVNAKYFGPDFDITYDDLFPQE